MDIINDELNKLRKLMGVHEKGLPHLLWKNKEDLKDEQKQQLERTSMLGNSGRNERRN